MEGVGVKTWWLGWLAILLVGCGLAAGRAGHGAEVDAAVVQKSTEKPVEQPATPSPPVVAQAGLPDYGLAPELENSVWLNVDHPLRLRDLRGKVVLLDMWTFDCIIASM